MNTQEARKALDSGILTPVGLSDLARQLCQAVDEAQAESRHLAEYETMYKTTLDELRQAHSRADRFAIEAASLKADLDGALAGFHDLETKCRYFLKANAWVRARIERLLRLGGIAGG